MEDEDLSDDVLTSAQETEEYWSALAAVVVESAEIRYDQKISQEELAQRMQSKQSVISRFENMGRRPSYDFLSRLALATGHKLGMTLYGEFTATVPVSKQGFIQSIAKSQNKSTETIVAQLLMSAIEAQQKASLPQYQVAQKYIPVKHNFLSTPTLPIVPGIGPLFIGQFQATARDIASVFGMQYSNLLPRRLLSENEDSVLSYGETKIAGPVVTTGRNNELQDGQDSRPSQAKLPAEPQLAA